MVYTFFGVIMTQLTKNFSLAELTKSQTASRRGLDNTPTPQVEKNLKNLAETILQPLREKLGKPIVINSGYRSPAVNAAVGGSATSAHRFGHAVDLVVPSYAGGDVKKLCQYIVKFLKDNNIAFEDYDVGIDTEKAEEMVSLSGQMGVPVINIEGEIIVGFDKEKIKEALGI